MRTQFAVVLLVCVTVVGCSPTMPVADAGDTGSPDAGSMDVAADVPLAFDGAMDTVPSPDANPSPDAAADASPFPPDAPVLMFHLAAAPANGPLTGLVRDFDSHAPLAGATVTAVGGMSAMTASDGTFALTAPLGRVRVTVTLAGYVPSQSEVPVGSAALPVRVNLRSLAPSQMVGPAGATLTSGAASLQLPPGAYPSPTSVSATWLDGPAIVAAMRTRRVIDATMTAYRALGVLHVEAASEPAMSAMLTVPVPAGVDAMQTRLVPRADDGTYGTAVAPMRTTASTAVFAVAHFSGYVNVGPGDPNAPSIFFPQADPGTTATGADGTTTDVTDGTTLASPTAAITAAVGAVVEAVDTVSETAVWYRNTVSTVVHYALTAPTDSSHDMETTTADTPGGTPTGPFGVFRFLLPLNQHAVAVELMLDTAYARIFHSGTIVSVEGNPCPASDGTRAIDRVETAEGMAVVVTAGGSTPVPAGQQATACDGCAHPTDPPVCCDANNCASGCCASRMMGSLSVLSCQPGNAIDACGSHGQSCVACSPAVHCYSMCAMTTGANQGYACWNPQDPVCMP